MRSASSQKRRVTIVGNRGGTNIGGSLERAALAAGHDVQVIEPRTAMEAPLWLRRFNWHLRGRRPPWLNTFSARAAESCLSHKSDVVIVTGISAFNDKALKKIKAGGIRTTNYLTDDPWNLVHKAPWFLKALPEYSHVFSPRHANLADLAAIGCPEVSYLPFGYDPEIHFPYRSTAKDFEHASDVLFVGGADEDRVPVCAAIAEAGISLSLYGDYWERDKRTRPFWKGHADSATLRHLTATAKVCLCLTRRANRDDHTMRSYEIAAMSGIILAEDTAQHRRMFGDEGEGAMFFRDTPEMLTKAKWLVENPQKARAMATVAYGRITGDSNTYGDRLRTMIQASIK